MNPNNRKEMFENIIVTGGSSCVSYLPDRLERELKIIFEEFSYISKLSVADDLVERQNSSWMGASMVASISNIKDFLMDKAEFEDHGSMLIERKCLC